METEIPAEGNEMPYLGINDGDGGKKYDMADRRRQCLHFGEDHLP